MFSFFSTEIQQQVSTTNFPQKTIINDSIIENKTLGEIFEESCIRFEHRDIFRDVVLDYRLTYNELKVNRYLLYDKNFMNFF